MGESSMNIEKKEIDQKFDTKELNDVWIKIKGHYDRG